MPDVEQHRRELAYGDWQINANEVRQLAVGELGEKIPPNFFSFSRLFCFARLLKESSQAV
jgi:hypothetical protein